VVGIAVLRQKAVACRTGDGDLMLHRMKLMGEIQDVTGDATGMSQIVGANEEDAHGLVEGNRCI
jgi:hypothetical protein